MSRVDVIVPCYKYAHFLDECVTSALTQRGVEVRVLVIDDASPDNTPEVGLALARRDPRVEYRRPAANIVSTPTAVVRTRLQHEIGGYRKDLPHTGDLEMWMRCAAHGSVGVLDVDQAFYRVHGNNMHKQDFTSAVTVFEQHKAAFEE